MASQPINPPKPHQKVELVTLNKFAKFHHYTSQKKPGLDMVKANSRLTDRHFDGRELLNDQQDRVKPVVIHVHLKTHLSHLAL